MKTEWHNADEVMEHLTGAQITNGRIEQDGLYLTFADSRVLVIVGLPGLGVVLIQPEGVLH
jgi:hypothetical protein